MLLSEKIMSLRKRNGWSQEELAQQLGVSRQSVSKWESMASMPDIQKIMSMSELFGVSTDYLLKDELEELPATAVATAAATTTDDADTTASDDILGAAASAATGASSGDNASASKNVAPKLSVSLESYRVPGCSRTNFSPHFVCNYPLYLGASVACFACNIQ